MRNPRPCIQLPAGHPAVLRAWGGRQCPHWRGGAPRCAPTLLLPPPPLPAPEVANCSRRAAMRCRPSWPLLPRFSFSWHMAAPQCCTVLARLASRDCCRPPMMPRRGLPCSLLSATASPTSASPCSQVGNPASPAQPLSHLLPMPATQHATPPAPPTSPAAWQQVAGAT
jgi:hypothetical protein